LLLDNGINHIPTLSLAGLVELTKRPWIPIQMRPTYWPV